MELLDRQGGDERLTLLRRDRELAVRLAPLEASLARNLL
jgi:hypothetical protein